MECLGSPLRGLDSLNACFPTATSNLARSRQPITALAARGFWNGVSDIKEVFGQRPNGSSARFYVSNQEPPAEDDNFFEEITTLYERQSMLFQRSCEQLKEFCSKEVGTLKKSEGRRSSPVKPPLPSPFGELESRDIEELYGDCLFAVLHMIGCDADRSNQWQLVEHLRKAFR